MDKRLIKTHDAIVNAFATLIAKRNFNSISIQDILDESKVGRSTFYAHFKTKEDLLNTICEDIFHHVFMHDQMHEKSHDYGHISYSISKKIEHLFYHIHDDKEMIHGILSSEGESIFLNDFRKYLYDFFVSQHFVLNRNNIPIDLLNENIANTFVGVLKWWLNGKDTYTPEQITSYFMLLVGVE